MAKQPKTTLNLSLLAGIAQGSITHISQTDGLPLLKHNPQLIEVDTTQLDQGGNALVRLTDAGNTMVANGSGATAASAPSSPYAVITNAVLPPSKRGGRGGGAPTVYPFDALEIGGSFFVPVSAKHPDPVKTLGSTVSSANMRFAEKTGEMKSVTRGKRGAKNKLVLDANGAKIMETTSVPVYKHTRKFSIRPVKAGQTYGSWVAPADGALIARVPLKDD